VSEVACSRAEGIDVMKRIVALRNFANTLANGKVIVIVFTLFDVAHRCYVIYTMYVVTTSVSCNILSL
jgi:hypothetical protein